MTPDAILDQVAAAIRDVLDTPSAVITTTTTAKDIPEWDSLTHFEIVAAIESHFSIRFTSAEIIEFKNVGDLCGAVERKLSIR